MRMLDHIDVELPLEIVPMTQDLDVPMIGKTDGLSAIVLQGQDVTTFLNWAKSTGWRGELERDLQSLSMDSQNRKMLSTWMPLVTFRTNFCGGGRQMQDEATQALMERLRFETREWRAAGCDLVDLSGRLVV